MRSATSHRLAATLLLLLTVPLMADVEAMPAGPGRQAATPTAPKTYAPYPEPENGYVTDKAGLLAPEQKERLNAYCYTTEKNTGVEVVVVVINSIQDYPGAANSSIETFAKGLFNAYGIGNMPRNDGVLLLVARRDRKSPHRIGRLLRAHA